jgi:plasmid stabilization system protein ParE
VVLLLSQVPRAGALVVGRDPSMEIRRLELRRTRYLVFYEVTAEAVTILRVWHGSRGERPPL